MLLLFDQDCVMYAAFVRLNPERERPICTVGVYTGMFRARRLKLRYFQQWSSQSRYASRQGGLR